MNKLLRKIFFLPALNLTPCFSSNQKKNNDENIQFDFINDSKCFIC